MYMHFVYVLNESDRDTLTDLGYEFIKADPKHNVYMFANKDIELFSDDNELASAGIQYVLSDIMTF